MRSRQFYFLEVNTRLQVEHPVTEMVTGLDLVAEQLRVAEGDELSFGDKPPEPRGWSMEARIIAEDPARNFMPSVGRIERVRFPQGPGVRNDSGIYRGYDVPVFYDSLLAKLVVWGADREQARMRLVRALDEFVLEGPHHNLAFHAWLALHPEFAAGNLSTRFVEEHWRPDALKPGPEASNAALLAAALARARRADARAGRPARGRRGRCVGMEVVGAGTRTAMKLWVTLEGREAEVTFRTEGEHVVLEADGRRIEADFVRLPDGEVYSLLIDGRSHVVRVSPTADGLDVELRGTVIPVSVKHPLEKMLAASGGGRAAVRGEIVTAPMPGVVVAVRVAVGDSVRAGQAVVVVEAMKMQNELAVSHDGVVSEVLVSERAAVSAGAGLGSSSACRFGRCRLKRESSRGRKPAGAAAAAGRYPRRGPSLRSRPAAARPATAADKRSAAKTTAKAKSTATAKATAKPKAKPAYATLGRFAAIASGGAGADYTVGHLRCKAAYFAGGLAGKPGAAHSARRRGSVHARDSSLHVSVAALDDAAVCGVWGGSADE